MSVIHLSNRLETRCRECGERRRCLWVEYWHDGFKGAYFCKDCAYQVTIIPACVVYGFPDYFEFDFAAPEPNGGRP